MTDQASGEPTHQVAAQTPAPKDVYVFARVKSEYAALLRNNLIKVMRIVPNYGGTIVGVSDKVEVLENGLAAGLWTYPMAIMVLQFPSFELAKRWADSDPVFKNKDFPNPASSMQMIAVPMNYIPNAAFPTFQMTMFKIALTDCPRFQTEYLNEVSDLYGKHSVCYGVCMSPQVKDMSFGWVSRDEYVSIHTFQNMDDLMKLYSSSEYEKLKEAMNCMTVSTTIAFTLN